MVYGTESSHNRPSEVPLKLLPFDHEGVKVSLRAEITANLNQKD